MSTMHLQTFILVLLTVNIFFECSFTLQNLDDSIVNINQGTLRGSLLTTDAGVPYYSFQGIPYAQPPVGKLRFRPPEPPLSWDGVRDATIERSICPQSNLSSPKTIIGDEDCLFLNVYSTKLPSDDSLLNTSVMVWIHGGGFAIGSGNTGWYGPDYLINNGDIVIVTINYRLAVLGFLGLNHSDVSKNNGLKDQVAALQWVRNNIDKFGGNPDDVTIFGESAGAISVHYHMLSPLSKGLFHKAISQSGSVLAPVAYVDTDTAHNAAMQVADILLLNTTDTSEILDYLLKAEAYDLVRAGNLIPNPPSLPQSEGVPLVFTATIEDGDKAFLPDIPLNLIKSGEFHQVPYITGVNSAEGKAFGFDLLANLSRLDFYNENFEELFVPAQLGLERGSPESLEAASKIRETYFENENISENTISEFVDLEGDYGMVVGTIRTIQLQLVTGNSPIYFYEFSYVGNLSLSEVRFPSNYSLAGASHGDDIGYLFKLDDFNVTVEEGSSDRQTVHRMTKLWTNFAKTGIPSVGEDKLWSSLSEGDAYMNIDSELISRKFSEFKHEKMTMWNKLYKNIDCLP